MLILFDHGTPKGLAGALSGHTIIKAQARGWDKLHNGALLTVAEQASFHLLLTTDRRIRYPAKSSQPQNRHYCFHRVNIHIDVSVLKVTCSTTHAMS